VKHESKRQYSKIYSGATLLMLWHRQQVMFRNFPKTSEGGWKVGRWTPPLPTFCSCTYNQRCSPVTVRSFILETLPTFLKLLIGPVTVKALSTSAGLYWDRNHRLPYVKIPFHRFCDWIPVPSHLTDILICKNEIFTILRSSLALVFIDCKYEYNLLMNKGKVKVQLSLCLTKHHAMKTWRYSSTNSLTSALSGGEWSASRHGRFTPRERAPVPIG
jgi:hypothetical protein